MARKASAEFCRDEVSDEFLDEFIGNLMYVPQSAGPEALATAVSEQRDALGGDAASAALLERPAEGGDARHGDAA